MIIYRQPRPGFDGYFLLAGDTNNVWDIGGTGNPLEATEYATKRECQRIITECAKVMRIRPEQFSILEIVK